MKVLIPQSCPTLCDHMDCSPTAPLSMEFSRQEYKSGLPFPSPGELPNPEVEPRSLDFTQIHCLSHQGSPGYVPGGRYSVTFYEQRWSYSQSYQNSPVSSESKSESHVQLFVTP